MPARTKLYSNIYMAVVFWTSILYPELS